MLKFYVKANEAVLKAGEAVRRLRKDQDGVVSFEYVIVAACIVATVVAVFGTGAGGKIGQALTAALDAIIAKIPT